jgi:hypothetical protein
VTTPVTTDDTVPAPEPTAEETDAILDEGLGAGDADDALAAEDGSAAGLAAGPDGRGPTPEKTADDSPPTDG